MLPIELPYPLVTSGFALKSIPLVVLPDNDKNYIDLCFVLSIPCNLPDECVCAPCVSGYGLGHHAQ